MRKRVIWMLTLLLVVTGVFAQKIDSRLTRLVEQVNTRRAQGLRPLNVDAAKKSIAVRFHADGSIKDLSAIGLLKKGAECPTAQLEQKGIEVRYQLGDMVVMNIPPEKLQLLDDINEFYSVRADEILQLSNDKARKETGADKVTDPLWAIVAGLPLCYTGKDVVLGIIDRGIDFNHAAFRNADGSTRVKKAVIYNESGKTEYDTEDAIMALTTDDNTLSHGTHTSATAGGSETGNGMQGVAPQADLVLCGMAGYASSSNIAECIRIIFDYATSVNKPAVVNLSMGSILGLHDGSEILPQAIGNLTENGTKPGRAMVVSSCNSAANWESIITYPGATCKTVLGATNVPTEAGGNVTYTGRYFFYASDYNNFTLELKLVNLKSGAVTGLGSHVMSLSEGEPCIPELECINMPTAEGVHACCYYLDLDGDNAVKLDNNDYRLALFATPADESQMIKMMCAGDNYDEPCFDAPQLNGVFNFKNAGYTKGNGDFAFSSSICSDAIISVGAYITRTDWTNCQGNTYRYNPSSLTEEYQKIGEIADFSSYGVDDNGKPRPTVIAPGMGIISAANNYDKGYFVDGQPGQLIEEGQKIGGLVSNVDKNGRNNWYYLSQGTSMSSPHAAGILTLWMQAKPTLTVNDIKQIMQETCRNDQYTTDTDYMPSGNLVQAGYGKIDCLAGLKAIVNTTSIETIEAGGHREATPATMYSVDAPVYNLMGQRIDKAQKGLVIYKGRKYVNK